METKLTQEQQDQVIEIIRTYRKLHDIVAEMDINIQDLNARLAAINTQKDQYLNDIRKNRETETNYFKGMVETYGPGKLNIETMEWTSQPVPDEITKGFSDIEPKIELQENDQST